jgi:uncharacterized membrane protein
MRGSIRWLRVPVLAALASMALCSGSPAAPGLAPFSFQVCNKTDTAAAVALYYADGLLPVDFHAEGWWVVNAGQCTVIDGLTPGWFYYYAKSDNRDWPGSGPNSANVCVSSSPQFKRIDLLTDKAPCSADETMKVFNGTFIMGKTFTWTLQ